MVFSWWVHNKKLFRKCNVKYRTFSEGPTWSDLFPLAQMKSYRKMSKNCCTNGNNFEISGLYNLWKPLKSSIPDVWNWNCWTLFGLQNWSWGVWYAPPFDLSSGYAPAFSKTHVINKKTTWHLNLRCGINKVSYSNLYLFLSSFHQDLITFWFISQKCVIIYTYPGTVWCLFYFYVLCV